MRVNTYILGAPKCGTTALHNYLAKHPDVCVATTKEPLFFESEYSKGIDYYHSHYYSHYNGQPVVCDSRPSNLHLPYVLERIKAYNPDAKCIVMLRDPVRRAFSHWWMRYTFDREKRSFRKACEASIQEHLDHGFPTEAFWTARVVEHTGMVNADSYVSMGYYSKMLRNCFASFPREQFLVLYTDDLAKDVKGCHQRLCEFLNIEYLDLLVARDEENTAKGRHARWLYRLRRIPYLHHLLPAALRRKIFKAASQRSSKETISAEDEAWLRTHFKPFDDDLAALLGETPPWRQ